MNEELSSKFPSALREALEKGIVSFPDDVLKQYDPFKAYRAIRRKNNEPIFPLKIEDFYSQVEKRKNNPNVRNVDETDIGSYSCSFFISIDRLNEAMSLPCKKMYIIYGSIKQEYGFVRQNSDTTHIDLWIFEGLQINKFDFEEVNSREQE